MRAGDTVCEQPTRHNIWVASLEEALCKKERDEAVAASLAVDQLLLLFFQP